MHCHRCGGAVLEAHKTLPYVGPGEYIVELRDVQSLRCSACRASIRQVPDLHALDVLIRTLAKERPRRTQLAFRDGRWRVAAWSSIADDLPSGQPT